jgi:hypothetical protein
MAIKFLANPTIIAECLALLFSLLLLNKKNGYWQIFALFLAFTISIEAISVYLRFVLKIPTYPANNFLWMVQLFFYSFLFYKFIDNKKIHFLLVVGVGLMLLAFLLETIKLSFVGYHKIFRQLLSLFVVLFSCVFYFQLFKNDEVKNPLTFPPFWIVTGLFIFYFGTSVIFAFKAQGIKLGSDDFFYNLIMGCLNCIFYGSWITAFIQCRQQQTQIAFSKQLQ